MKPSDLLCPLATLTTLALLSCENPADNTTDAEVKDKVLKETSEAPVNANFNIKYPGKTDDLIREEVVLNFALEAKPE